MHKKYFDIQRENVKSLKAYSINFDVCGQCTRDEFQKTKPKIICLPLESIEIAI